MLNLVTLPSSPGMARRLLAFSRLNGMKFDDAIVELAMTDLVGPDELQGSGLMLSSSEFAALQYVLDWKGRALLLDTGKERTRKVALASLWSRPLGQTVVLARPREYAAWATEILKVWPSARISVFGNPRYNDKADVLPNGLIFSETPDITADFLITSYGGLIYNDLVTLDSLKYSIIEEFSHNHQVNYKWQSAVTGVLSELPCPLVLQDAIELPTDHKQDVVTALQTSGSTALTWLGDFASLCLFGGNDLITCVTDEKKNKAAISYLSIRGYTGHHLFTLLSAVGISTDLLTSTDQRTDVIAVYDNTVSKLKNGKKDRKESGLHRLIQREAEIKAHTGLPLGRTILDALDGDDAATALVDGLMTTQWASVKAQHLKKVVDDLFTFLSRIIIVADRPELIRSLRLQFGGVAEHLSSLADCGPAINRFIGRNMLVQQNGTNIKPLRILIVSKDELDPSLLEAANFLIVGDWPRSLQDHARLDALAQDHNLRMVYSVLRDTFETELFSQLTQK